MKLNFVGGLSPARNEGFRGMLDRERVGGIGLRRVDGRVGGPRRALCQNWETKPYLVQGTASRRSCAGARLQG